jgi:methionine synthase II (cobalamin-independent)
MTTFYLTGSINVPTIEDAFALVGSRLQPGVTRVPDGEPGDRANWVLTQAAYFLDNPTLDVTNGRAAVRAGTAVSFPAIDYHSVAAESYRKFLVAREKGTLAADSRFLVSIPTPFNAVNFFVEFDSQVEVAKAYERPLKDSVDAIQAAIPHRDLVIQWDLPVEDATVEGWFPNPYRDFEEIYEVTARPASWVQDDVELAFHLCYGDSKFGASPFMGDPPDEEAAIRGGRHVFPRDASAIVAVSNGLSRHVPRRIDAIQAATVTAWNRLAHWQPLANLAIEPETEFYLGLVHAEDGAAGARYRAALASKFLQSFGLSTECGLGRHSAEQLDDVARAVAELFETKVGGQERSDRGIVSAALA